MEVRRIGPDGGFLREMKDIQKRIRSQETRASGNIVIRETLTTSDPSTGVSAVFGQLPSGDYGFQPFIGDITPPPVASMPVATSQPGYITIAWDGNFVNNEVQPRDFEHLNVMAHKIVNGATTLTVEAGVVRLPFETLIVGTDLLTIGETWQFSFESEDFNGNISARSARTASITVQSAVTDSGVNQALADVNNQVISAQSAAASAQTSANNAQKAADDAAKAASDAAGVASSKSKVLIQSAAPAAADQNSNVLWIDTTNGLNAPKRWDGATWVTVTDKAATDAATAAANAQTKADQAFNNAASAATAAGNAQTTADGKNRVWYQTTAPAGTGNKVGDTWFDTANGYKIYVWDGSTWKNSQDTGIAAAQNTANTKTKTYFQTNSPAVTGNTVGDIWFDTDDSNRTYVWNGTAWADARDATIATAQTTANNALTSANGKNRVYYQGTMPSGGTYISGDTWFDTSNGNKIYVYNGSSWIVSQDTAIGKSILGTFSTDIDTTAQNNWLFTRYDKVTAANTIPSYLDIVGIAGTSSLIADSANLVVNIADNYIGQLRTIVNVVSAKTISITGTHDDGAQVYVDGVSVYSKGQYTAVASISFSLSAGWHVLDFLWAEQMGGDGWSNIAPTIGSQVTSMYAPVSNTVTASTANSALSTANSKIKTYFQSTQPGTTGNTSGDIWFDTGNGNKTYVWNGSAWTLAQDAAIAAAQTSANGKNTIYYQSTSPAVTGRVTGDTWFDTGNGYKIYVWNGSAWTASQDTAIASAQSTANTANTTANSKTKTFIQGTAPTATAVGDIWIDTANGNVIKTWEGSSWVTRADAAIAAAQSAANAAQTSANGKNTNISAATAPATAGHIVGDLWFDTSNGNKPMYFNGSAWVSAQDASIATAQSAANTAQTTANGKNTATYSSSAASGSGSRIGDIWFQTNASNIIIGQWQWNGSAWIQQTIDNAVIANLDAGKITAGFINAARIQAGTITSTMIATDTITAGNIAAGAITASELAAGSVQAQHLTASAISATAIAADSITTRELAAGSITAAKGQISDLAVTTAKIADTAITNAKIANLAVGTAQIQDAAINNAKIANLDAGKITTGTLDANRIGADTITAAHIASDAITANELAANSITAAKGQISALAVGTAQIQDTAITNAKIGNLAVGTAQIQDTAITNAKIANLDAGKITTGYLDANRIAAQSITAGMVATGLIQAGSAIIANGAIGTAQIGNLQVKTANIDDTAITNAKIADATIQSAKIGSVDAGTITAGTISAARIGAKSITTDKLVVSSTNNLIVEADFSNGGSSWGPLNANKLVSAGTGRGGLSSLRITGTTAAQTVTNLVNKVTVGAEDRFRGSFYMKCASTAPSGAVTLNINAYVTATSAIPVVVATSQAITAANQYVLVEGYSPALPAGTIAAEFFLTVTCPSATGTIDVDYVAMTRAADARLVVDGAIDGKTINGVTIVGGEVRTTPTAGAIAARMGPTSVFDPIGGTTRSGIGFSVNGNTQDPAGMYSTTGTDLMITQGGAPSSGSLAYVNVGNNNVKLYGWGTANVTGHGGVAIDGQSGTVSITGAFVNIDAPLTVRHRRAEFSNGGFDVGANALWDIGVQTLNNTSPSTVNNDFSQPGPYSGSISFTKSGYYALTVLVSPQTSPGGAWVRATRGSDGRYLGQGSNGLAWESMVTLVPFYFASGDYVRFQYLAANAHNIKSWVTITQAY